MNQEGSSPIIKKLKNHSLINQMNVNKYKLAAKKVYENNNKKVDEYHYFNFNGLKKLKLNKVEATKSSDVIKINDKQYLKNKLKTVDLVTTKIENRKVEIHNILNKSLISNENLKKNSILSNSSTINENNRYQEIRKSSLPPIKFYQNEQSSNRSSKISTDILQKVSLKRQTSILSNIDGNILQDQNMIDEEENQIINVIREEIKNKFNFNFKNLNDEQIIKEYKKLKQLDETNSLASDSKYQAIKRVSQLLVQQEIDKLISKYQNSINLDLEKLDNQKQIQNDLLDISQNYSNDEKGTELNNSSLNYSSIDKNKVKPKSISFNEEPIIYNVKLVLNNSADNINTKKKSSKFLLTNEQKKSVDLLTLRKRPSTSKISDYKFKDYKYKVLNLHKYNIYESAYQPVTRRKFYDISKISKSKVDYSKINPKIFTNIVNINSKPLNKAQQFLKFAKEAINKSDEIIDIKFGKNLSQDLLSYLEKFRTMLKEFPMNRVLKMKLTNLLQQLELEEIKLILADVEEDVVKNYKKNDFEDHKEIKELSSNIVQENNQNLDNDSDSNEELNKTNSSIILRKQDPSKKLDPNIKNFFFSYDLYGTDEVFYERQLKQNSIAEVKKVNKKRDPYIKKMIEILDLIKESNKGRKSKYLEEMKDMILKAKFLTADLSHERRSEIMKLILGKIDENKLGLNSKFSAKNIQLENSDIIKKVNDKQKSPKNNKSENIYKETLNNSSKNSVITDNKSPKSKPIKKNSLITSSPNKNILLTKENRNLIVGDKSIIFNQDNLNQETLNEATNEKIQKIKVNKSMKNFKPEEKPIYEEFVKKMAQNMKKNIINKEDVISQIHEDIRNTLGIKKQKDPELYRNYFNHKENLRPNNKKREILNNLNEQFRIVGNKLKNVSETYLNQNKVNLKQYQSKLIEAGRKTMSLNQISLLEFSFKDISRQSENGFKISNNKSRWEMLAESIKIYVPSELTKKLYNLERKKLKKD